MNIKKMFFSFVILVLLISLISKESNISAAVYNINVGDVLDIFVRNERDLNSVVIVRPDGNISFPLVGDILSLGLEPQQLSENLKKELSKYIKDPQVTVILKQFASKKVYIFGEVQRPGEYLIEDKIDLMIALTKAGSYKETADLSSILVIKKDKNKNSIKKEINFKKFLIDRELIQNDEIEPGDVIYVPRIFKKIYVLGEVKRPGVYNLEEDSGILEAITNAGGYILERADVKKIMVVRKGALESETSTVDLGKFIEFGSAVDNIEIKRGDIIYVPTKSFNKVYVMGEVNLPGLYSLEGNMTVMGAIIRAGGHKKTSALKSVMLIRKKKDENDKPVIQKINIKDVLEAGKVDDDMKLSAEDVVYVPKTFIASAGDFVEFFFKNINPALDTYLKAYEVAHVKEKYDFYRTNSDR